MKLSALFVGRLFGGPDRLKRITRYQGMDSKIDCSPDGTRILFSSPYPRPRGSSNVFSVRTDGSGLVQLTRSHGGSVNNIAASWSPDGTKIAFIRYRHRSSQLYVMNADGTAVTQVTHGPEGAWRGGLGQPSLTAIEEENMNGHVRAIVTSVVSLACAFVVVFTATASGGASSSATFGATNGLLAYHASLGKHPYKSHSQIFTVQPNGTHVHQLNALR